MIAVSPAAMVIAKAKNKFNKKVNAKIKAASIVSKNEPDIKGKPNKAGVTVAEKKAIFRISGSGPSITDKVWIAITM